MDLLQLLDNLGVLKAITHNFKYILFGLAGALIQIFFMKKNGQAVTWSLLALIVILCRVLLPKELTCANVR